MCEDCNHHIEAPSVESRRGFFHKLAGIFIAVLAFPRLASAKKVGLPLDKVEALQKVGGSATLKVKERKILFVRDSEASVRAIDPNCTHKKCTVKFTSDDGQLHCPCHKSAFALDGKVLDGPAPRPLTVFPAELAGNQIVVTLPDEAS